MNAKNFSMALAFLSVGGGCAAFVLRLLQLHTGFEIATGLPIPGNPAALILLLLLAGMAAAFAACSLRLPGDAAPAFPFSTDAQFPLALIALGSLSLLLSGVADLLEGVGGINLLSLMQGSAAARAVISQSLTGESVTGFRGTIQILSGLLTLLSAAGLLACAAACRNGAKPFRGGLLMISPVAMVVRLVAAYRMDSINPVLEDYVVQLLALALLTLGFYHLAAFPFASGDSRRFMFYTCAAVPFCLCALADGGASGRSPIAKAYLSAPLLYLGGAAVLLGFLLLALDAPARTVREAS